MMESFFGILKSKTFYSYEKKFKFIKELEEAIVNNLDYYTNKLNKIK